MFSGIVECTSSLTQILSSQKGELLRFKLQRPNTFTDLKIGDSIAVNGVCLTVEEFDDKEIQFAIGKETLDVTKWSENYLTSTPLNLEQSLKFGDRIHGHLVTGHVDFQGQVDTITKWKEGLELWVSFPKNNQTYFWPKGSVCLNGVSLTVNEVKDSQLRVNLIPETLRATNLKSLKVGDTLNIEIDTFARGLIHYLKEREPQ